MDVQTGQGKKLPGKGNASTAVYCYGHLYIIDGNGDIRSLDPNTGEQVNRLTICGKFKDSKGLACYQNYLWAVGKNRYIYKIDPKEFDEVTQIGTLKYTNTGPMTSREWKARIQLQDRTWCVQQSCTSSTIHVVSKKTVESE